MSTSSKPPIQAALNYQKKTEGQRIGRYIDREDEGGLEDVHYPAKVDINDARLLSPSPSLEKIGFELRRCPTYVNDFLDDEEVKRVYYPEMNDLILVFYLFIFFQMMYSFFEPLFLSRKQQEHKKL